MGTKIPTNQKGVVVCSFLLEKALVLIRVCILVPTPPVLMLVKTAHLDF